MLAPNLDLPVLIGTSHFLPSVHLHGRDFQTDVGFQQVITEDVLFTCEIWILCQCFLLRSDSWKTWQNERLKPKTNFLLLTWRLLSSPIILPARWHVVTTDMWFKMTQSSVPVCRLTVWEFISMTTVKPIFSMWGGRCLTVCMKLLHGPFWWVNVFYEWQRQSVLIYYYMSLNNIWHISWTMFYNVSYREWWFKKVKNFWTFIYNLSSNTSTCRIYLSNKLFLLACMLLLFVFL